ncbi:MAG: YkgJ family cysteine cluster protein [Vampirovibrionales bacterium]|nr:YkgJ family cysteine cluster protein [Vampirovibrionales bacterium]
MALSDSESPLGMAQEVERLLKMPQTLCKQRGICCRVATFKGSLSIEEIHALGQGDTPDAEHARAFASIFEAYPSQAAVREIADAFVDRVREKALAKGKNPDDVTFFKCRFVLQDGRCGVHEDRPTGCRAYPFPHKNTVFHPGCGFEAQSAQNWARIEEILRELGMDPDSLGAWASDS